MKATKKLANVVAAACFCAASGSAFADGPNETYILPTGVGCPTFTLKIEVFYSDHRQMKEFKDANGNLLRLLRTGTGNTLVFTNVDTGKQLSLKSIGSVENIVYNADGSQTYTVMGHNVLILFPGDTPSGPSSILYVGRIVFQQSPVGVTTVQIGPVGTQKTDICAALQN